VVPVRLVVALSLLPLLALATGCGGGGDGSESSTEPPPAEFSTRIDNPYLPLAPGDRWVYRETGEKGAQRVIVTVAAKTKRMANGVDARVVHDVVTKAGMPLEVTDDWYAQDARGNVWYMGERTAEYENGKVVSREGSWEAGVDGARPGVVMFTKPRPGMSYRQEHYAGEAEDRARVLSTDEQAEVPFGHFSGVLLTRESTPLEPKVLEYKLYAHGVGLVLTLDASGESGREELLTYTKAR
jgi:hypothetical protein